MTIKTLRSITLITITLLAVFTLSACGNSAEKLNNEGNEEYAQQAYEQALASYQSAQAENPELVEPHYNAANTLYRAGDYAGALEELQKALALTDGVDENPPLEVAQASYFNAGNSSYNTQELEAAVDAYSQALLLNPDDLDAKYNLELALQQQQQQEQEQEQENQDQEQSEDSEDQNQDQPQDGEQNNEQEQEQSENGENEEQNQDESENQSEEGQNQDEPQEGDEQESDQQQDGEPQDEPQDEQEGEQQPGEGEPQPAEEDTNGQPSYAPAPGERMSEEQAKQLLAAIAGDSDTLMERLNQILTVNMQPPMQDW
jgi:Ca-activated chloride channel family protein